MNYKHVTKRTRSADMDKEVSCHQHNSKVANERYSCLIHMI